MSSNRIPFVRLTAVATRIVSSHEILLRCDSILLIEELSPLSEPQIPEDVNAFERSNITNYHAYDVEIYERGGRTTVHYDTSEGPSRVCVTQMPCEVHDRVTDAVNGHVRWP